MKVLSAREVFSLVKRGGADNFEFSYILVELQDGHNFYSARSSERTTKIDASKLETTPIRVENYRPLFSDELTIAPALILVNCWEKFPNLPFYNPTEPTRLRERMLREARVGESLMQHPHPNVATYHGCVVRRGRIARLCFTWYYQNLVDRVYHDTRPFDIERCLQDISKGIQHLHSLGIVHNDITPNNIMLTSEDAAVVIDFDSCLKEGEKGFMESTRMWTDASYSHEYAKFENDLCGLRKIREWLHDPTPFELHVMRMGQDMSSRDIIVS